MGRTRERLLERLRGSLSHAMRDAMRWAVSLAERRGVGIFLVGGGVRDLLLGGAHLDLDLVVEGDALGLASAVAAKLEARIVTHPRFGTAVVRGEGFRLDFAQARQEHYERPGALPTVRPGRLDDDLARRDFAVNAMALHLSGTRAGQLIDPHGGRDDLERRRIRVLHGASFQDDATRMLRALRYAGRLRFRLEPRTRALLIRDLSYLDAISGARLRHEFERIAAEKRVKEIAKLAGKLGVLAALHPALRVGEQELRAAGGLPKVAPANRDAVLFCLLLAGASQGEAEDAIARLALTGRQAGAARGLLRLRALHAKLDRASMRPSAAARLLAPLPPAAIEAFALLAQRPLAADRARRYLEEWRSVRSRLNGRDLEALGVPHGPEVGAALISLREARLDGRTRTRKDEEDLVRRMQQRKRSPTGARRG